MNRGWQIAGVCSAMLLVWAVSSKSSIREYVEEVKNRGPAVETVGPINAEAMPVFAHLAMPVASNLLERIKTEAERRFIPPIDAKLDPVWKAIPGYNGLEVDVEQTYRLAKQRPEGDIPFVYRQVPPKVSLEDLGAQPIYKGNPKKPMVSLMINVAWGEEFLPRMLEILNKENVRATFFFDGTWLSKNMGKAKEIGAAGHELSNHAYTHPNMSQLSRARATAEISKTEALLQELGVNNKLFAPPSGDYNKQTVQIAHELGLKTVLWTIDTVDWKNPGAAAIIRRVVPRLEPGALILMHPTQSSSDALASLIAEIKRKGLVLDTVSELLSPERIPQAEPVQ